MARQCLLLSALPVVHAPGKSVIVAVLEAVKKHHEAHQAWHGAGLPAAQSNRHFACFEDRPTFQLHTPLREPDPGQLLQLSGLSRHDIWQVHLGKCFLCYSLFAPLCQRCQLLTTAEQRSQDC